MGGDAARLNPSDEALASLLETLASPVRLEILRAFRLPRRPAEVRIVAERSRAGENPGRVLSRQTVQHHIDQLVTAGLLVPSSVGQGRRGQAFVIDHARMFAILDGMRDLARLRPLGPMAAAPGATMRHASNRVSPMPPAPRLVVAFGRDEGTAYPLGGDRKREWTLGRAPGAEIRLDYDPYASAKHARIVRDDHGYSLEDLHSTNGTWVDWELLTPGAVVPLRGGAVIMVGRSVFVLQR